MVSLLNAFILSGTIFSFIHYRGTCFISKKTLLQPGYSEPGHMCRLFIRMIFYLWNNFSAYSLHSQGPFFFLIRFFPGRLMTAAGWCFVTGIVLFSGSLYALAAVKAAVQPGFRWLGPVTPVGGVFFIAGWLMMLAAFFKKPVDNP